MTSEKYWLAIDMPHPVWREVTKSEWVWAEKAAGFRGMSPTEPATAGFTGRGVVGKITYEH